MVKTILIDLDETLLDFSRAEACALERALRESGAPYSEEIRQRYHAINGEQWELLEDGVLTREQALVRRFERLLRSWAWRVWTQASTTATSPTWRMAAGCCRARWSC